MNTFAVLDTETTGLSPLRDRILQLGVAVFRDGELVKKWSSPVNPGVPISEKITVINGFSNASLANAPNIRAALDYACAEIPDGIDIVAHNADFDQQFWLTEAMRCGKIKTFLTDRWFCSYALAKALKGAKKFDRGFKLTELCEKSDIAFDGSAHDAANDAEACGRLFLLMQSWLPKTADEIYAMQIAWMEANR